MGMWATREAFDHARAGSRAAEPRAPPGRPPACGGLPAARAGQRAISTLRTCEPATPGMAVWAACARSGPSDRGRGARPPARRADLTRARAAGAGAGGQGARQGAGDDRQEAPAPAQPGRPDRQGVCRLPRAPRGDAGATRARALPAALLCHGCDVRHAVAPQERAHRQPAPTAGSAGAAAAVQLKAGLSGVPGHAEALKSWRLLKQALALRAQARVSA